MTPPRTLYLLLLDYQLYIWKQCCWKRFLKGMKKKIKISKIVHTADQKSLFLANFPSYFNVFQCSAPICRMLESIDISGNIRTKWVKNLIIGNISPYSARMRENTDQENSNYWHFSSSVEKIVFILFHPNVPIYINAFKYSANWCRTLGSIDINEKICMKWIKVSKALVIIAPCYVSLCNNCHSL